MNYSEFDSGYFLVFEKGDDVIKTFTQFCKDKDLKSGVFSGIGAFSEAQIGHYSVATKRYTVTKFSDSLEVLNINGNISIKEGEPFVHMHAMLSDTNMDVIGGHLIEAKVSVTLEVYVRKFDQDIKREFDPDLGLHLINNI